MRGAILYTLSESIALREIQLPPSTYVHRSQIAQVPDYQFTIEAKGCKHP
jgi:hypothetical protein